MAAFKLNGLEPHVVGLKRPFDPKEDLEWIWRDTSGRLSIDHDARLSGTGIEGLTGSDGHMCCLNSRS